MEPTRRMQWGLERAPVHVSPNSHWQPAVSQGEYLHHGNWLPANQRPPQRACCTLSSAPSWGLGDSYFLCTPPSVPWGYHFSAFRWSSFPDRTLTRTPPHGPFCTAAACGLCAEGRTHIKPAGWWLRAATALVLVQGPCSSQICQTADTFISVGFRAVQFNSSHIDETSTQHLPCSGFWSPGEGEVCEEQ